MRHQTEANVLVVAGSRKEAEKLIDGSGMQALWRFYEIGGCWMGRMKINEGWFGLWLAK